MPFKNKLHNDELLSILSVKYSSGKTIWSEIFPVVPVKKDSDKYRVYSRNLRIPETKRANKGLAKEHDFDISSSSYILEKHALKSYISDDDVDNYDLASLKADTTEELTDVIDRRMERSVASLMTKTSWSLTNSLAATAVFTLNTTGSTPLLNFQTAATTIIANSGGPPNKTVIPRPTYLGMTRHNDFTDRIKYTSSDITAKMIAAIVDLDKVLIPSNTFDNTEEGQTSVIVDQWGDNTWIGFVPPSPGPRKPSAGYMFRKNKNLVKTWRDEERESVAIEVNVSYVPKVISSLSGYLIANTH